MTKTDDNSSDKFDLDQVLTDFGNFGWYQIKNFIFYSLPLMVSASFTLSYVFTANSVNYRCYVPECDGNDTSYQSNWLSYAVPYDSLTNIPTNCEKHLYIGNTSSDGAYQCSLDDFNSSIRIRCNEFVYQSNEISILNDLNLQCEENKWKLALVGTLNNIGQFLGLPLSGFISDRYGRRTILIIGTFGSAIFGIIKSFSINYPMFITMEFMDAFCASGIYAAGFLLGMELVTPKYRVTGGMIIASFYSIGEALLGLIAWVAPSWRVIVRCIYTPALLVFIYPWIVPESVRWLLAKRKILPAISVLQKTALASGTRLSEDSKNRMLSMNHTESNESGIKENYQSSNSEYMAILRSPKFILRILNCSFCWITNTFVYYGLSLNSVSIAGNQYLNFILVCLIEMPAYVITYAVVDRIGRKVTLCGSLIICGLTCLLGEFVPLGAEWYQLVQFLIGKLAITVSFTVLYVYTAELFPTTIRNSLLGTCSMLGRIGSIVAPLTPLLATYQASLPMIMFGSVAFVSGILILEFPETRFLKLPETVSECLQRQKAKSNPNK